MHSTKANKPWLFRIYEWPLSYFFGLLIGSSVALGFAAWDSSLRVYLEPTGILLFLSGWAIIIGSGFGNGMDKIIDLPPPTRIKNFVFRSSIAIGVALNATAWTFFTTPLETWGEQFGAAKPYHVASCETLFDLVLNPVSDRRPLVGLAVA